MRTNYAKGRAKEYELIKRYEEEGYICFRSAGSHTIADIVAIRPDKTKGNADLYPEVRLVQSKTSHDFEKERMIAKFNNNLLLDFWQVPYKDKKWMDKFSKKAKMKKEKMKKKK
jgi:hypothetical protein